MIPGVLWFATREATRGVRLEVGRRSGELDALCEKYRGERGRVLMRFPACNLE